MDKPRIFLGSSTQQVSLLQAVTRGLDDIAQVDPWTTVFNAGTSTLDRLVELTRQVDFAAFVFAHDDWTAANVSAPPSADSGQASPRDNVVFEAGLFGGALGMRRTFILHAHGAKLPTDLLGLTSIRYGDVTDTEVDVVIQKLRKAIEDEGRIARIEGSWWQFSLTERTAYEPYALALLRVWRGRDGELEIAGRAWEANGKQTGRWKCEASRERRNPSAIFYYWHGDRPRDPRTPQFDGTGEILLESADRATGYWTTRSATGEFARTVGDYRRADPEDLRIMDGSDDEKRAALIAERLKMWKSIADS